MEDLKTCWSFYETVKGMRALWILGDEAKSNMADFFPMMTEINNAFQTGYSFQHVLKLPGIMPF